MKWRVLAILVIGTFALIAGCIWLASKAVPAVLGAAVGLVPVSWEKQLGEATVEQTTRLFQRCEESSTVEPIAAIVQRLESGMAPHPYRFRVLVVDSAEVNAFAAPGGRHCCLSRLD